MLIQLHHGWQGIASFFQLDVAVSSCYPGLTGQHTTPKHLQHQIQAAEPQLPQICLGRPSETCSTFPALKNKLDIRYQHRAMHRLQFVRRSGVNYKMCNQRGNVAHCYATQMLTLDNKIVSTNFLTYNKQCSTQLCQRNT